MTIQTPDLRVVACVIDGIVIHLPVGMVDFRSHAICRGTHAVMTIPTKKSPLYTVFSGMWFMAGYTGNTPFFYIFRLWNFIQVQTIDTVIFQRNNGTIGAFE